MGRGQGRPQRLYSGVERRPAISMKSKKKFMILWVLLIAVLFAGSLLTAPPGKTETIQTAMRDAVLHEENQISLFGWKNVNPGLISAMTVSADSGGVYPRVCHPEIQGGAGAVPAAAGAGRKPV